ncbi:MAG: hypothetical protein CMD22_01350 [Flavobacteriales bacterium]|nr:hypothetical protein [Flavobacteriales bacterium]|tara:strand:- start:1045 stop:1449 length:405 start_codon:yes stop_codon:yes gene_type:complete
MKKIFILFSIFLTLNSFSQVENGIINSRYMEIYKYNTYTDKFELSTKDWVNTMINFQEDYYTIIIEDGEPSKVYWEFYERNDKGEDIYYTQTERKFIINYDEQEIKFYSDYNEYEEIYTQIIVLSKISKYNPDE